MVEASPGYYVTQAIFFTWQAILLGFALRGLIKEIKLKGWVTARSMWLNCLTCGITINLILQFDPRGIHGLFPAPGLKCLEWMTVLSVLVALMFTAYMYLIVLYRYNMSSVPIQVRNTWIILNIAFMIIHVILVSTGSLLRNQFIYGIDGVVIVIHEDFILLALNISIHKLSNALRAQTQEVSTSGYKSDFSAAIKKLWHVRIGSLLAALVANIFQLAIPGAAIDRLSKGNQPIVAYDNSSFSPITIVSPFLVSFLFTLLLYTSRRPQKNGANEKSSPQTTESPQSSIAVNEPSRISIPSARSSVAVARPAAMV